jgi:ABC-type phosphate transport system substrate-binding protein
VAGTVRKACAEAAPPSSGRKNGKVKKKPKSTQSGSVRDFHLVGPTDFAAMQDGAAYVNAVAARVDLVGASVRLVCSEDEKIAKAELDRVRDMKFGKGPVTVIEEVPRVELGDMPRPAR